jgi:transposase
LEDQPTAYLDEMQDFLYYRYNVWASIPAIYRTLKQENWSRKVVQQRAAERSVPLRNAWKGLMPKWDASELVFLDESAANERTGDRKRGWSLKGLICPTSVPIKRSERWSILPALTIDGYLDFEIFQGSITSEIFLNFVEQKVLPHCNPRPGPRSVLVLDNASIHRNRRLRELCDAYGVALEFLPPYSPDFNPIEATFHDLKAWIRRNYRQADDFADFGGFLEYAVNQTNGQNAKAHYKHAGYVVED